jgi:hypothetical protein
MKIENPLYTVPQDLYMQNKMFQNKTNINFHVGSKCDDGVAQARGKERQRNTITCTAATTDHHGTQIRPPSAHHRQHRRASAQAIWPLAQVQPSA